ncbi:hypothetical protein QUC31_006264 [Theobroma cacao]
MGQFLLKGIYVRLAENISALILDDLNCLFINELTFQAIVVIGNGFFNLFLCKFSLKEFQI